MLIVVTYSEGEFERALQLNPLSKFLVKTRKIKKYVVRTLFDDKTRFNNILISDLKFHRFSKIWFLLEVADCASPIVVLFLSYSIFVLKTREHPLSF